MVIQSKKVWIADQFIPAIVEMDGGKITAVAPYGSKAVDVDYGSKRIYPALSISTAMVPTSSTPMTRWRMDCVHGPRTLWAKV